ncbi:HNH endonuclease [Kribbella sp. NPDC049584]|uniref:HNH endonuclease signature motif containing protein n=1 Tax=Kribbella sp. NPDC049584 TaxID=3154833 RepID=UPI00342FD3FB
MGDTVHGDGLSAAAIRRLACDAKIIPLVLGSRSEPLDVGRSERLVTRAMRRALNTRDGGCVVCGAPPVMCDAHHLISWIDGGETSMTNLVLLCRRHHIDLHAGHWCITIVDGDVQVVRPAWADPPPPRSHPSRPSPTTTTSRRQAPRPYFDLLRNRRMHDATPTSPRTSARPYVNRPSVGRYSGNSANQPAARTSTPSNCAPRSTPRSGEQSHPQAIRPSHRPRFGTSVVG